MGLARNQVGCGNCLAFSFFFLEYFYEKHNNTVVLTLQCTYLTMDLICVSKDLDNKSAIFMGQCGQCL